MRYFLGADLGATKTHTLIVDENGNMLGFGESGPGNHETVGYDGMFEGGAMLIEPMRETIHKLAPKARLVRLMVPPVLGAVMLGMEASGMKPTFEIRDNMKNSVLAMR